MESGVKHLLQESRKTGRPIRLMHPLCFEESELGSDRRFQRELDSDHRRERASKVHPFNQEIQDLKRERDYYRDLISQNSSFDLIRKLEADFIVKISELKKQKDDSNRDRLCSRIYELEEELKETHRICRDNFRDASAQLREISQLDRESINSMRETAKYNTDLIVKNRLLEARIKEVETAYNRLVYLTKQKLGSNAPHADEIKL